MIEPSPNQRWISGYDGLRALACIAVFGVHLHQLTGIEGRIGPFDLGRALENGNTGVALFFLLSAFLLSQPFWAGKPLRLGGYAVRRAVRLLPAYYLCLTALAVTGKLGGMRDVVLHYLFIHNLTEATIYGVPGGTVADNQFWTIAVQAQFYVVLPLLLLLLRPFRGGRRTVGIVVLLVLSVVAFVGHLALLRWAQSVLDWPWPTGLVARPRTLTSGGGVAYGFVLSHSLLAHLPHFLLGMAAGGVYATMRERGESIGNRAAGHGGSSLADLFIVLAALAMIVILATPLDESLMIKFDGDPQVDVGRYNWPIVPLLIATVLVLTPMSGVTRRVLDVWPLRMLGVISFGVYVYHPACQVLTVSHVLPKLGMDDAHDAWWAVALVSLAMTIVIATMSFLLIERPLLRLVGSKRGSRPPQ